MTAFWQDIISGVMIGSLYGLIALGFVLIYKSSQVLNFAQGEVVMFGGFIAVALVTTYSIVLPVAFLLTLVFAGLIGLVIERGLLRPLIGKPLISIVMATIGLASVLRGLAPMLWGSTTLAFPSSFLNDVRPVDFLGVPVARISLWSFGFAVLFVVLFGLFFKFTRTGLAMQAVADDQQAAMSMGISVPRVFAWSWAIALVVAAIGGTILGNRQGVDISLATITLKVFPVVILGGLDSITGAIVAGIAIGVIENLAGTYVDPHVGGGFKDVAPYVVMVFVLMIRPHGLFGSPEIERV
ncbi:MAG TPA: branched-chain amino acid ABC transporter permease [Dehalococcoidia bacterium]|nr:branched-chain amino acid ABC transporter permease [Dehalococcoidia bacterium]